MCMMRCVVGKIAVKVVPGHGRVLKINMAANSRNSEVRDFGRWRGYRVWIVEG